MTCLAGAASSLRWPPAPPSSIERTGGKRTAAEQKILDFLRGPASDGRSKSYLQIGDGQVIQVDASVAEFLRDTSTDAQADIIEAQRAVCLRAASEFLTGAIASWVENDMPVPPELTFRFSCGTDLASWRCFYDAQAGYFTTIAIRDGYIAPSRTEELDRPR